MGLHSQMKQFGSYLDLKDVIGQGNLADFLLVLIVYFRVCHYLYPLLHLAEDDDPLLGSWNLAAYKHDVVFRADVDNLKIEHCGGLVSELSRHFLALEHLARPGALTDGTRFAVNLLVSVRGRSAAEIPAADDACESTSLDVPVTRIFSPGVNISTVSF